MAKRFVTKSLEQAKEKGALHSATFTKSASHHGNFTSHVQGLLRPFLTARMPVILERFLLESQSHHVILVIHNVHSG